MSTKDGGQAFPQPLIRQLFQSGENGGMTLRDWFAGMALHSVLASDSKVEDAPMVCAQEAYRIADAMLAERAKDKP